MVVAEMRCLLILKMRIAANSRLAWLNAGGQREYCGSTLCF